MQPTKTQVHIDRPLTDYTIAQFQSLTDFVATSVVPSLPVDKQSNKYFKYRSGDFARDAAALRAAGAESVGTGFNLSDESYSCDKYALHVDFDYDTLANADEPLRLEEDAVRLLTHSMAIRREAMFAAAAWRHDVWASGLTANATNQWSSYASSDPIIMLDQAKRDVRRKLFREPNTLILGEDAFLALKEHPDLVGRIVYTKSDILDNAEMARLLGVERLVVAKALVNGASEGKADSVSNMLSAKNALLVYLPETVGLMNASGIVAFDWTGAAHLPRPQGFVARRFEMEERLSRRIEVEMTTDIKVVNPEAGFFFNEIVA
jgi:hypothetical protein